LYYWCLSLLPTYDGTLGLKGLKKDVRVVRDSFGIPYIYAKNLEDLYRAFGFVHAQDRLFQIDIMRRLANGRLSEVLGEKALAKDRYIRTLRISQSLREQKERYPDYYKGPWVKHYQAYADGLNQFVATRALPLEFHILNYKPSPFTVEDLIAISGYMALTFAHGIKVDSLIYHLESRIKSDQIAELTTGYLSDGPTILSKISGPLPGLENWSNTLNDLSNEMGYFYGSNSWLVSANRSSTGLPVLVNDPHIRFTNPSIWYEAHLEAGDFALRGFFLAGFPFALLGHNERFAFGLTMLENDDMNLYLERFSEDGSRCLFKRNWLPLQIEHETIPVKGRKKGEKLIIRSTPHGPVISDFLKTGPKDKAVSLSWTFHDPHNRIFEAFYRMNHARSPKEFSAALPLIASPGLNVSYADQKNIGWWATGKLVEHREGLRTNTLLDATTGEDEILGSRPFSANPSAWNPKRGYLLTANNPPEPQTTIPGYYMPADRAIRIEELLKNKQKLSIKDHQNIQTDSALFTAVVAMPRILEAMGKTKELSSQEEWALRIFEKWDFSHEPEEVGAAIYQEWAYQFLAELLDPVLGEKDARSYMKLSLSRHFLSTVMKNGTSKLLGSGRDFDSVVIAAFKKACANLSNRLGYAVDKWGWGKIHTLEFKHPLARAWPLNHLFNLGPFAAPGVKESINSVGGSFASDRFQAKSGPSTRRIIALGMPDESLAVIPTGNSGNRFSSHYGDQTSLFLKGIYRKLPFSKNAVEEATRHELILKANY